MPTDAALLVIQPDASDPLDRFEAWLADEGLTVRVVRPYAGEPVPSTVDADGLLVLGGEMDSWDDVGHPWLAEVRALLRVAADTRAPTLGICLGAQLLALAHGGRVERGEHGVEAGLAVVRRTPDADVLLDHLPGTFRAATLHGDAVTELPAGSTWLAEATPYRVQAFRVGTASWGVQFHPEVSPARYRTWLDDLGEESPADRDAWAAAVTDHDDEVAPVAEILARAFAGLVRAAG